MSDTDISDVLISWGKSSLFWIVVLVVVVIPVGILDHKNGWGVLASIGQFFTTIADILKQAFTGIA